MAETEEVLARVKIHLENRKNDLEKTLEEYQRFKELAAVEEEKARPILNQLSREGNKGIVWGFILNILVLLIGIILGHYLKIWIPNFIF